MGFEDFLQGIDRRTFLRIVSFTGITGLIYPRRLLSSLSSTTTPSRVVIVEDGSATSGFSINQNTVQIMMDSGVKALAPTQPQNDIGEAWKELLPNINSSSIIAIKVNCFNSSLPTHPEVTYTVVNGLTQMNVEGSPFPENNIIIYDDQNIDLTSSGYTVNTSSTGVRCFGTNSDYSAQDYDIAGISTNLSRIVTEMADYLINISVLKSHSAVAGVTLCLKNHYGSCKLKAGMHDNYANPCIPALNALSPFVTKQKVNICDALLGIYSGGPMGDPQFRANKIILSQDIVAADYCGRELLEDNGCTITGRAHHIDTAATVYGLGTNDPAQIDVVDITNPSSSIDSAKDDSGKPEGFHIEQNYPNPFNNHTEIRFYIAKPTEANVSIFNSGGRQVRRLLDRKLGTGWHQLPWDGRNDFDKQVASGTYVCQLRAGAFQQAIIVQLVK